MGERRARWVLAVEIAIVIAAIALRLVSALRYRFDWGYDYWGHLDVIRHAGRFGMPPVGQYFMAYNPPLYYLFAGAVWRATGESMEAVRAISLVAGIARVLLIWWAARLWLVDPVARLGTIVLAGFLPASLHIDLMVSNESLNATLGTASLVFVGLLWSAERPTVRLAALCGGLLGLTLLTKVSVFVVIVVLASASLVLVMTTRWRRLGAMTLFAVALALVIGLPAHQMRRPKGGPLFATMYTAYGPAHAEMRPFENIPLWKRRPLAYYGFSGTSELLAHPYWPTMSKSEPRYFPLLAVTLWVDYYYFSLSGVPPPPAKAATMANGRPVSSTVLLWARASAVGALWFAAFASVAWCGGLVRLWRARDPRGVIVFVPGAVLAAALYFCLSYPLDRWGSVKGTYLLFGWLPVFLSYGVGIAWLWARPRWRALTIVALVPIALAMRYDLTMWF